MNKIHLVRNHDDTAQCCKDQPGKEPSARCSAASISSGEALLLRYGRGFYIKSTTMGREQNMFGDSYASAIQEAIRNSCLTYVEGYCDFDGFTLSHGWVVNQSGVVIEQTLPRWVTPRAYFGIPFQTSYLKVTFISSDAAGPMLFLNKELYLLDAATLSKNVISGILSGGNPGYQLCCVASQIKQTAHLSG